MSENKIVIDDKFIADMRQSKRLLISTLLGPVLSTWNEKIRIIQCGTSESQLGDWELFPKEIVEVFAFEPIKDQAQRKNDVAVAKKLPYRCFPMGLKGFTGTYSRRVPSPDWNEQITDRIRVSDARSLASLRNDTEESNLDCITLSDWSARYGIKEVDFISVGCESSDAPEIEGKSSVLSGILGITLRVTSQSPARWMNTWAEVERAVSAHGLQLYDAAVQDTISPGKSPLRFQPEATSSCRKGFRPRAYSVQFAWLRDLIQRPALLPDPKVIKLICLAEYCGQVEYAFELLDWMQSNARKQNNGPLADLIDRMVSCAKEVYAAAFPGSVQG